MSAGGPASSDNDLGHCGALVREADSDRFFSAMTARVEDRDALFAIYAFNHEIAKIPEVVSEPMLGQIRVQWWRDAIEECFQGTPRRHRVVQALADAVQTRNLSRDPFEEALDAREGDLDPVTPATLADLVAYARSTSGSISCLAGAAVGLTERDDLEAARMVGTAWGLVGLVRALPFHLRHRRCVLPSDLLAAAGIDVRDVIEGRRTDGLPGVVRTVCLEARDLLHQARARRGFAPRGSYGALSLGVLADAYLRQMRRCGHDPFDARLGTPPATRTLALLLRSWGERF